MPMIALASRAHTFARLASKEDLIRFYTAVLGCDVLERPGASVSRDATGRSTPVYAFPLPNGGSFSVEFTEDALEAAQARRGAYLQLRCDDPLAVQEKIVATGIPRVEPFEGPYFYFQAPGGQVWRLVPAPEQEASREEPFPSPPRRRLRRRTGGD